MKLLMLESVDEILGIFDNLQHHPSYLIRNRIYPGGGIYGSGLQPLHHQFNELISILKDIPVENIMAKEADLYHNLNKFRESIKLLTSVGDLSSDTSQFKNMLIVAEDELIELQEILIEIKEYKLVEIDQATILDEKIQHLHATIEDNLVQVTRSSMWKLKEAELMGTIDGSLEISEKMKLLHAIVIEMKKVTNPQYLESLALLVLPVRNLIMQDFDKFIPHLNLIRTFSIIFQDENYIIPLENRKLTPDDIRSDLEHNIHTHRLPWLSALHETTITDNGGRENLDNFFMKLFEFSRDPKAAFFWTMTTLARVNNNEELEKLTIAYANLASSMITLTSYMVENKLNDFRREIMNVKNLSVDDAIEDLSELYNPMNINVSHLIKALRGRLEDLKDLALQAASLDDLAESLFFVLQYTDPHANLKNIDQLDDYLRRIGS